MRDQIFLQILWKTVYIHSVKGGRQVRKPFLVTTIGSDANLIKLSKKAAQWYIDRGVPEGS